jgi:hypothetical protein
VIVWRVVRLESSNYLLFSLRDCFVCLFLNTLLKIGRGGETLLPTYTMGHNQSVIHYSTPLPHTRYFPMETTLPHQQVPSHYKYILQLRRSIRQTTSQRSIHTPQTWKSEDKVSNRVREKRDHTLVVAHGVHREECFSASPNFQ